MTAPLSRRAALGALASLPALAAPAAAVMLAETTQTLAGLIAAHTDARAAFENSRIEFEAADEAFSASNAAWELWSDACELEEAALDAICRHRCESPDELARKVEYLWGYRNEMEPEQFELFMASFLPESPHSSPPMDTA